MRKTFTNSVENHELVQKLIRNGYGDLVSTLLNESDIYTRKDRLNKSALCRKLDCSGKELDERLRACKELLGVRNAPVGVEEE